MKRMMTLIGIILGLLLTYYTIVLIAFLVSTGLFKVILLGSVVIVIINRMQLVIPLTE